MICYLTEKPNSVTFDPVRDQFILACDNGELFSLPTCAKCNEYRKISENDLYALIYANNCLFIVGDEYSAFVKNYITVRILDDGHGKQFPLSFASRESIAHFKRCVRELIPVNQDAFSIRVIKSDLAGTDRGSGCHVSLLKMTID